jgi:putative transposase
MAIKAFEFKLYQSKKNKKLHCVIDRAALVYNYIIEEHRIKKTEEYKLWKTIGSQALQDIVERIERAYNLFF